MVGTVSTRTDQSSAQNVNPSTFVQAGGFGGATPQGAGIWADPIDALFGNTGLSAQQVQSAGGLDRSFNISGVVFLAVGAVIIAALYFRKH